MIISLLLAASVVPAGQLFDCTPTAVWDGDGPIWCAEGAHIRLSGIAAREMDGTCRPGHPCPAAGPIAARDHLVALLGKRSQPWVLALSAQAARRVNDVPMTVVCRDTRQRGNELVVQAVQTIPLRGSTDLQLYAGYRRLHSNYALREYSNRFAGFSLIQAF